MSFGGQTPTIVVLREGALHPVSYGAQQTAN